jgi:hypothetical protein
LAVARSLLPHWHNTRVGSAVVARRERAGARPGPWTRAPRAEALAMLGRVDEARAILTESRAVLAERGAGLILAGLTRVSAEVELLADDPAAATELGTEACRPFFRGGREGLPLHRGGVSRAGALRGRSAGGSGELGRPRSGARRQRRRHHGSALAPGQGEGARTPGRARGGRAVGT